MSRKYLLILILFFLNSCSINVTNKKVTETLSLTGFKNNGFTLLEIDRKDADQLSLEYIEEIFGISII